MVFLDLGMNKYSKVNSVVCASLFLLMCLIKFWKKIQETLTVTLLGLTVWSLISSLFGLCVYLCNQIVLYITQMTRRFFFFSSKQKYNFCILDTKMIQTQTMQPYFFINPLKHSGYYWTIHNFLCVDNLSYQLQDYSINDRRTNRNRTLMEWFWRRKPK